MNPPTTCRIAWFLALAGAAFLSSCADRSFAEAWVAKCREDLQRERVRAKIENAAAASALEALRERLSDRRDGREAGRDRSTGGSEAFGFGGDPPAPEGSPVPDEFRDCLANLLVLTVSTNRFDRIDDAEAELEDHLPSILGDASLVFDQRLVAIRVVAGKNPETPDQFHSFSDFHHRAYPSREQAWSDRGMIEDNWDETFSWTNYLFRPRTVRIGSEGFSGDLSAAQTAKEGRFGISLRFDAAARGEAERYSFETGLPSGPDDTTYFVEPPVHRTFRIDVRALVEAGRWEFLASGPDPLDPDLTYVAMLKLTPL